MQLGIGHFFCLPGIPCPGVCLREVRRDQRRPFLLQRLRKPLNREVRLLSLGRIVAVDHPTVGRPVTHGTGTIGRGRLLCRGHSINPYPAHASRWPIVFGNFGLVLLFRGLAAALRRQAPRPERETQDGRGCQDSPRLLYHTLPPTGPRAPSTMESHRRSRRAMLAGSMPRRTQPPTGVHPRRKYRHPSGGRTGGRCVR